MPVMSVSWNASEPISLLPTWPVMQTIGDESIIAVAMPVTMLVAPGPGRRDRHADLAARARVAVGHVRRALLVADEHVADRIAEHRVVGRQDRAARIAEHVGHPFANERFPEICAPVSFMCIADSHRNAADLQSAICNLQPAYPVTAPVDADDTSRAYFAITPVV